MSARFLLRLSRSTQPHVSELIHSSGGEWIAFADNIALFTNVKERALLLPGGRGVIFGHIFHRYGPAEPLEHFTSAEAGSIEATGGTHLFDRYWGRYLAVIRAGETTFVLRDPSGTLPCVLADTGEAVWLASEAALLVEAGAVRPQVDVQAVARTLYLGAFPEEETALTGIRQLLPGARLRVEDSRHSTSFVWSPWNFVPDGVDQAFEEQAVKLRRVTQSCVTGWGRLHNATVLGVSGGLDSSIVAACLRGAGKQFSCVTLATDDPLGDERGYSRAIAAHVQSRLFEERYVLSDVDLDKSSVARLPKPFGRLDSQAYDAAVGRVAREVGAQAIFTGNGGDNIFYMSHSARPLADRYLATGASMDLLKTTRDISKLTGANGFQVAWHGIRVLRNSSKAYGWKSELGFLAPAVASELDARPVRHAWLDLPDGLKLPGKAAHIAMLLRMHYSLDAYASRGDLAVMHPLVSQPIIEHCLQIPTWQQCAGGYDRSVARRAFSDLLPSAVVQRSAKGSPQGFTFAIFERFRQQIRERLFDGFLMKHGIIDRAAIETVFQSGQQMSGSQMMQLLTLVDTEAWVLHWRSRI